MYVDNRYASTCHEHVHVRGYVYRSMYKCMYIYVYILTLLRYLP